MKSLIALLSLSFVLTSTTLANVARVTVEGSVVSNDIQTPPLGGIAAGEPVVLSFEVGPAAQCCDEENCGGLFCRYPIDESTFELGFGGGVTAGLSGSGDFTISIVGGPAGMGHGNLFLVSGALDENDVQIALVADYVAGTFGSFVIEDLFGEYDAVELFDFRFHLWSADPDDVVTTFGFDRIVIEEIAPTPNVDASWSALKAKFYSPTIRTVTKGATR